MINQELETNNESATQQNFVQQLTSSVDGLLYPSESDEKIKVIDWQADNPAPFDVLLLKKYLGLTPKDAIMQRKWEDFLNPLQKLKIGTPKMT